LPTIPPYLLKQLYVKGSLQVAEDGFQFSLQNNLASATITGLELLVDSRQVPAESMEVSHEGIRTPVADITADTPFRFTAGSKVTVLVRGLKLGPGTHDLSISLITREIGAVTVSISDTIGHDPS
jgi:hypothetical protein